MKRAVWLVILAAGYSRRMGAKKLLLPVGEETMIRHVVKKALLTKAAGVAVIVNGDFPELTEAIQDLPVHILQNHTANLGMSSSLRIAVEHLIGVSADAGCVLLADQPEIETSVINRILLRYEETGASIVQAAYQGKPGHPVLFSGSVFNELKQITGDKGGRDVIIKYAGVREMVHVPAAEPEDIDVYEDYERLIGRGGFRS